MAACVLLTTCNLESDGTSDLMRLLDSVAGAAGAGEVESLRHVVLLQNCREEEGAELARSAPPFVEFLTRTESLSPSTARNVLIDHWRRSELFDAAAFVGFPDDDAWYPPGALSRLSREFDDQRIQFLLCRYGPDASSINPAKAVRPTLQQALSRGSCAAMFVRGRLLERLGGFNELLGIRTTLSGGEDTEFSFRAFNMAAGQALFVDAFLVGHAASNPAKRAGYYEGGLAAIMAHSRSSAAGRVALARKLLVGLWLVANRRLSWRAFSAAVDRARKHVGAVRENSVRRSATMGVQP